MGDFDCAFVSEWLDLINFRPGPVASLPGNQFACILVGDVEHGAQCFR